MKRREFFSSLITRTHRNVLLDSNAEVNYDLGEYTGDWRYEEAAHLLRRALFGFTDDQIQEAIDNGLNSSVDKLLNSQGEKPDPPVKYYPDNQGDDGLEIGETYVDKPIYFQAENFRTIGVFAWWADQIRNQNFSIREKMVMFWHNHFATQSDAVRISRFQYQTNQLFRDYATGNFKELATKVTHDPTMMLFLNGNENIAGRPNENYARELFELFTVGKGEQISEDNYTNYTENDIREAAKVLTGWNFDYRRQQTSDYDVEFRSFIHDYSTKKFSSAFGNKVIQPSGEGEYYDLMNMIFEQVETSKYITRELYKFFVFYEIDSEIETNIIEPLAKILRDNNFEIKPVLSALLKSNHFFDTAFRGAMIKNPVDYISSLVKQADFKYDNLRVQGFDAITLTYFNYNSNFLQKCSDLGLELGNPPSVAGWEAYYQTPGFYRIWISSVTLPLRAEFANGIFSDRGLRGQVPIKASSLELVGDVEEALYPEDLIEYLNKKMLSIELTSETKSQLKLYLVQEGQGDYVWSEAWTEYKADPDNVVKRRGVETKLNNLITAITNLSEYQLM